MTQSVRKTTTFTLVMLLAIAVVAPVQARAIDTEETEIAKLNEKATSYVSKGQWDAFSQNLVVALKSDYDGLKVAAMGMVIRYGDQLDVGDAVFDVMRIYRTHEDQHMRRMALVTLGEMNNDWAIGFLERAEQFEKSPVLLQTIRAVVSEYRTAHAG